MARIAVIGMGYVGLNIAAGFGRREEVIGFDVDEKRIEQLKAHHDRYNSVPSDQLKAAKIIYSSDESCLKDANFYIIAVPTPANATHEPELSYLEGASTSIARHLKKGDVVVNESTVYPGATEEICMPILEKISGLKSGVDFFVGYSPERINPGDEIHTITKIKKIISGQNPEALEKIKAVYVTLTEGGLHLASTIKAAEAVKVFENTQRDVNIALLNEFVQLTTTLGIDIYEVIDALKTKWNYLDFAPGFVGGHCISVDPYYLTYKARQVGLEMRLIETARQINNSLSYLIQHILTTLTNKDLSIKKSSIAVFGLTYKENIPDFRNSLSIDLVTALKSRGLEVYAHDPLVAQDSSEKFDFNLTDFEKLPLVSAIVITKADTVYKEWGLNKICEKLQKNGCIFDIPGMFRKQPLTRSDIHYEVY
jgi:UDP-N-acetyl-D-galactosamine dehydrogenase